MKHARKPAPECPEYIEASGYVVDESAFHSIRDIFTAIEAVALAFSVDEDANICADIRSDHIAAMLLSWSRFGGSLTRDKVIAFNVPARRL